MTTDGPTTSKWADDDGGRSYLRTLPVLAGASPEPDVSAVPVDPVSLFVTWLRQAVAAGVPEPHAMTLSTVDAHGMPRGRVLILKAVDEHGWHFEQAHHKLDGDPGLVPAEWTSYAVRPVEVEFWQGSSDRRHWRLSYQRVDDHWDSTQLWP